MTYVLPRYIDSFILQQRMDQYFQQIDKIIKERKTSSRVRFMLKDVVDLRLVSMFGFQIRFGEVLPFSNWRRPFPQLSTNVVGCKL